MAINGKRIVPGEEYSTLLFQSLTVFLLMNTDCGCLEHRNINSNNNKQNSHVVFISTAVFKVLTVLYISCVLKAHIYCQLHFFIL